VQLQQHAEQLREHQARLARSERLESVGRLASGVAHDFANVLQVIELSAEHMRSTGRASRPEDVDDILAASRRGRDLARQLLALGRPVEDRVRVFDLAEHVAELKPMLARLAAGRDLQIELTTASLPVRLDPSHADQLLINLVVNAAQATNDGGQIVLSCAADAHDGPRRACLSVRDNGQGIPADVLPHIFEPFYTTKSRDTGTGLGLSTVWSIVQQSGGDVDVESRVAVGTRFAVTLPLAELPRA
jgi:signal transduction histidine kinase